ncbi:YibE/F family protein [Pseudarthrobacter sp. P1]|uniref:YibE/F family protein n=1 Tax=Pseudarthrobacter sp. P1 TaxID=3418418 RepID=UPI003CF10372
MLADAPPLGRAEDRALAASRRRANILLTAVLAPLALLAVVAMVLLWPDGGSAAKNVPSPYTAAAGASIDTGTVQRTATEACPGSGAAAPGQDCFIAYTVGGGGAGIVPVVITPEIVQSRGVKAGDTIRYLNLSGLAAANPATAMGPQYVFMDFVRTAPIGLLALLYAVVVIAVVRWRGLRALIGLGAAFGVLAAFMLPALVEGKPPLLVGLVGATVIMFGVLYFAHGFSARTSTALLGTLFGLGITASLAAWATDAAALTGTAEHNSYTLMTLVPGMSLSGMILCGLIISGLGVLNDVTITQSSAVWELYELAPQTSARTLFTSALRIGRDHIASTVYTIAFAYAGSALPVLILVSLYDRPLLDALTGVELAEEVVRILVGSIGLVLAIPVTTAVAVAVVKATGSRRSVKHASAAAGAEVSGPGRR